jgi:hypothetical protein
MHEFSTELTFIADPAHGWLRVPLVDIAALGLETTISSYSYIDGHYAYLEEDADCADYLEALRERTQTEPTIQEEYREHFSRNRPTFGEAQFTAEFWDRLRR